MYTLTQVYFAKHVNSDFPTVYQKLFEVDSVDEIFLTLCRSEHPDTLLYIVVVVVARGAKISINFLKGNW